MGRASRRREQRRNAPTEQYRIRPAAPDDDLKTLHDLLEAVDFLDAAMPAQIVDRLRTGLVLPSQFGTSRLLVAEEFGGRIVAIAHAIPPVQWLLSMADTLGRELCVLLSRTLVELEAVSVADRARGHGLGHRLVDDLVRFYSHQGYQAMLGGIHAHKSHLELYYEAAGFSVLPAGAPLDLCLPIGTLRYPAEPNMRHLARPLSQAVTYRVGALHGLLDGRQS